MQKSVLKRNIISVSIANLISQFLTFGVVAYSGKVLGTAAYGDFSAVQAIVLYFTMFVMLGLQTYGTRRIAQEQENAKNIIGDIISIRIITSIICFVIVMLVSLILIKKIELRNLLIVYTVTLIFNAVNLDWIFAGFQKMHYNAIYNLIKTGVPLILVLIFVKSSKDLIYIAYIMIAALFIGSAYQFYVFLIKEKLSITFFISVDKIKQYVGYGYPFMLSGILATINCNVDRIVIEFTRSSSEAGIYSSGYNIIMFITNIISMIFIPLFPVLIEHYHNKRFTELKAFLENIAKIIFILSVPITVGGIMLARNIILFIFKPAFESAYISFSILMIYVLLLFVREIYAYSLNAWNKEKVYLKIVTISSFVNLVLNLAFTPYFGMNIAAIITVLSEIINLILMRKYANSICKIEIIKFVPKIIIPNIVMAIFIYLMKLNSISVPVEILVSVIVYFICLNLFKVFTIKDIKKFIK